MTDTLTLALETSGCNSAEVLHKPRLLSDNGSSSIAGELANWPKGQAMEHVRGAPNHPQTQGKIERWHQTLKNRVLLENDYLPDDLEAGVGAFVEYYNHHRYHESLGNLTPPTSILDAARSSYWTEKGLNEKPSNADACSIAAAPPKIIN